MRVALVVGLMALLVVPSAAPRGIPEGEVLYAVWTVGHRFTREEWLERSTGSTHRRDTGGPACPRITIATSRAISFDMCEQRRFHRVRGAADRELRDSSDLLRPRRMLSLGQAKVEGPTTVDGLPATRVRIPMQDGTTQYADLNPRTRLPYRFVFLRDGVEIDHRKIRDRSKRRSSLPKDFFSPRR